MVLFWCFKAYNKSPSINASYIFYPAYFLTLLLLLNYLYFYAGGFPSNTQTASILFYKQSDTLDINPNKCPVLFPYISVGILKLSFGDITI